MNGRGGPTIPMHASILRAISGKLRFERRAHRLVHEDIRAPLRGIVILLLCQPLVGRQPERDVPRAAKLVSCAQQTEDRLWG